MEKEEFANATSANNNLDTSTTTIIPTLSPTIYIDPNTTIDIAVVEKEHETDAITVLLMNVTIIGCLLLAYYVKYYRIYFLPESAGALIFGMFIGGVARLTTDDLKLFEFSPEVFFFFLLPPIIFEAGYSLKRKDFFANIGAITLYAMIGTMVSTFFVGFGIFYFAKWGFFGSTSIIDTQNPMEALLFGALISAVDPVATLSIMGSPELNCDPLLYSLVFGESVLNDAIAISLFRVFLKYYDPDGPDFSESEIPAALASFCSVSILSILVGVVLGLAASYLYKHTSLSDYPNLETSLLFCFCYLCYATAEALELSGIMALFFNGIVLSHYNSYNLSSTAHVASEQIFSTVATVTETIVFVYMGMIVFTGKFANFSFRFSLMALILCLVGRLFNIFPLSYVANLGRRGEEIIPVKMQCVLWFAGLRGAIAFALAVNMPGVHSDIYATATLSICIFTTVVCGGFTEKILSHFGMRQGSGGTHDSDNNLSEANGVAYSPRRHRPELKGFKRVWKTFDDEVLKHYFGGSRHITTAAEQHLGNYELGSYSYEISTQSSDHDHDDDIVPQNIENKLSSATA